MLGTAVQKIKAILIAAELAFPTNNRRNLRALFMNRSALKLNQIRRSFIEKAATQKRKNSRLLSQSKAS